MSSRPKTNVAESYMYVAQRILIACIRFKVDQNFFIQIYEPTPRKELGREYVLTTRLEKIYGLERQSKVVPMMNATVLKKKCERLG
jgi:hypothetical protein